MSVHVVSYQRARKKMTGRQNVAYKFSTIRNAWQESELNHKYRDFILENL